MQTPGQADDGIDSFENFLGDFSNDPEIDLMRKTIWESVQNGLAELPEEQRDVFVERI